MEWLTFGPFEQEITVDCRFWGEGYCGEAVAADGVG